MVEVVFENVEWDRQYLGVKDAPQTVEEAKRVGIFVAPRKWLLRDIPEPVTLGELKTIAQPVSRILQIIDAKTGEALTLRATVPFVGGTGYRDALFLEPAEQPVKAEQRWQLVSVGDCIRIRSAERPYYYVSGQGVRAEFKGDIPSCQWRPIWCAEPGGVGPVPSASLGRDPGIPFARKRLKYKVGDEGEVRVILVPFDEKLGVALARRGIAGKVTDGEGWLVGLEEPVSEVIDERMVYTVRPCVEQATQLPAGA